MHLLLSLWLKSLDLSLVMAVHECYQMLMPRCGTQRCTWQRSDLWNCKPDKPSRHVVCVVVVKTATAFLLLIVEWRRHFSSFLLKWTSRILNRSKRQLCCERTWLVAPAANAHYRCGDFQKFF